MVYNIVVIKRPCLLSLKAHIFINIYERGGDEVNGEDEGKRGANLLGVHIYSRINVLEITQRTAHNHRTFIIAYYLILPLASFLFPLRPHSMPRAIYACAYTTIQ